MAGFVKVEGLRKRFGDFWAIDDVSFEIEEGQLLVLLGPSGCGKTTTLRSIGGLEHPTHGRIEIDGQDITNAERGLFKPPEARGMGMVAQSYAIWPHMSVFENVAFPIRMRGIGDGNLETRVDQALDLVRLAGLGKRNATDLSGGQQQRVALARAIVGRPKVLLFDEPLSNLDAKLREQMRYLIKDIQRETKITAVYVTHDQAEAMGLGDELIVMNAGRIEQRGPARQLYCEPQTPFVADFIGIASLIHGRIVETPPDGGARVRLGSEGEGDEIRCRSAILPAGSRISVLVRPEWIALHDERPTDKTSVLEAEIRSAHYLGDRTEVIVRTRYQDIRVNDLSSRHYEAGQPVFLSLDESLCRVIPPAAGVPL